MSILITGGSGLLGSNLHLDGAVKPTSSELNLLDYNAVCAFIEKNNITKIIHAAALVGGVQANTKLIYDFYYKNNLMNLNILEACREYKLNNSIFILSTCIFPEIFANPYIESDMHSGEPHYTNYGYAYAKRMLEVGSRSLKEQYGINTTCLIPCNFYGQNDNHNLEYGHVIPSLIYKCYLARKNNTNLTVWGSGMPEREFIFVEDFVKIITDIVKSQEVRNINYPNKLIVSSGIACSIKEIVKHIIHEMNFQGNVTYNIDMPDGILKKPTNTKLFESLFPNFKWTTMELGIKKSVNYFEENYPNVRT